MSTRKSRKSSKKPAGRSSSSRGKSANKSGRKSRLGKSPSSAIKPKSNRKSKIQNEN